MRKLQPRQSLCNATDWLWFRPQASEQNFHRQLGDTWVSCLAGPECAEGRIVVQLVERADLICSVYGACADTLRSEVRMVQDVEVLAAELHSPALGYEEILRKLHIPIRCVR